MKKNLLTGCMVAVLAAVWTMPTEAGETAYRFDPVSQKSRPLIFTNTYPGFVVFKNNCKSCHVTGNDKGARFLHSESKSARAWKRVFLDRYPECSQKGYWDSIPQEKMLKLHDYLHSEARDSYNPYSAKGNC